MVQRSVHFFELSKECWVTLSVGHDPNPYSSCRILVQGTVNLFWPGGYTEHGNDSLRKFCQEDVSCWDGRSLQPISGRHLLYNVLSNLPFPLLQVPTFRRSLLHPHHHQFGPGPFAWGEKFWVLPNSNSWSCRIQRCKTQADDRTFAKEYLLFN